MVTDRAQSGHKCAPRSMNTVSSGRCSGLNVRCFLAVAIAAADDSANLWLAYQTASTRQQEASTKRSGWVCPNATLSPGSDRDGWFGRSELWWNSLEDTGAPWQMKSPRTHPPKLLRFDRRGSLQRMTASASHVGQGTPASGIRSAARTLVFALPHRLYDLSGHLLDAKQLHSASSRRVQR